MKPSSSIRISRNIVDINHVRNEWYLRDQPDLVSMNFWDVEIWEKRSFFSVIHKNQFSYLGFTSDTPNFKTKRGNNRQTGTGLMNETRTGWKEYMFYSCTYNKEDIITRTFQFIQLWTFHESTRNHVWHIYTIDLLFRIRKKNFEGTETVGPIHTKG